MAIPPALEGFLRQHRLPNSFATLAQNYYYPLLDWLRPQVKQKAGTTFILGINGCQGSGKSTLADFLATFLGEEQGWTIAVLSIDDLYLTKAQRAELASDIHPLLSTRGVPGTHDVKLGEALIDRLCSLKRGERLALPRFDKGRDDRAPEQDWPTIEGPIDLLIFEGWCVASQPQPDEALSEPVNQLEAEEDRAGHWRRFANTRLKSYQPLFQRLDKLVLLKAPDFDCVQHWRLEQEQKLAASIQEQKNGEAAGSALMDEAAIARFIQHYQRLTQANFDTLPAQADVCFELNAEHQITHAHYLS